MAKPKAKIDPELVRQLDSASGDEAAPEPVRAVFYLRPGPGDAVAVPPDQIQELVDALLERVRKSVGSDPGRHNTFRNLGSFVVEAAPGFIRELIRQPEVASAVANRRGG